MIKANQSNVVLQNINDTENKQRRTRKITISDRDSGRTKEKGSAIQRNRVKNSGNKLKPWCSTCGVQKRCQRNFSLKDEKLNRLSTSTIKDTAQGIAALRASNPARELDSLVRLKSQSTVTEK